MGYNKFYISFYHIFWSFTRLYSRETLKWQNRFGIGEERCLQKGKNLFASVMSAAISGMEVCPVNVEADVSDGLPCFTMVGFPSTQVKEAPENQMHQALLPPREGQSLPLLFLSQQVPNSPSLFWAAGWCRCCEGLCAPGPEPPSPVCLETQP